jgi:hypothetical protein
MSIIQSCHVNFDKVIELTVKWQGKSETIKLTK